METAVSQNQYQTALLVIDMQNDYFNNPILKRSKIRLTTACNRLIRAARLNNRPIICLKTIHDRNKQTWSLNMLQDNQGFLFNGTKGADYVKGLDTSNVIEITKTRDSGLYDTELLPTLRQHKITHVVLCGISTHSCVALTAIDAYNANFHVILARDAIGTHDPDFHQTTFRMLAKEYRMPVVESTEVAWQG